MSHTSGPWTVVRRRDGLAVNPPGVALFGEDEAIRDNAHLIAAAPDLLEACKAALSEIHEKWVIDSGPTIALEKKLRAVIAKAEGMP